MFTPEWENGKERVQKMKKLFKEEKGASAVEYAMLIGLISLFSFAAYMTLGRITYAVIENMWRELTGAGG